MSSVLQKETGVNGVNGHSDADEVESGRGFRSGPASPIWLVMAADEAFAMPMTVALFSVLHHLPPSQEIRIVALDAGVTAESKARANHVVRRASRKAQLEWVCPDASPIEGVDHARSSQANLYLFLAPEVLPNTCDRALYLDSDLVVERSILPLWQKPLGSNAALAVPERIVSCPNNGVAEWERLGLDGDELYFNSGVMLLNLEVWREQNVHGQAIDYLLNPENRFCHESDQEALNAVLAGQWKALDPRWNVFTFLYDAEKRAEPEEMLGTDLGWVHRDPFVIHYTTDGKPWWPSCMHPDRDRFFHYLRRSGWFTPSSTPPSQR